MSGLLTSRGGRVILAAIAGIVCLVVVNLGNSATFSDYGISGMNDVTVDCGGAFSSDISVDFDAYDEQLQWDNYNEGEMWDYSNPLDDLYIFEGQNARQVCKDARSDKRNLGIGSGVVAGLLLLSALFTFGKSDELAMAGRPPLPGAVPGPVPGATPAVPRPTTQQNPARWAVDPFGRFALRYWDGTRWTQHVSTNGVQQVDPPR